MFLKQATLGAPNPSLPSSRTTELMSNRDTSRKVKDNQPKTRVIYQKLTSYETSIGYY